MITLLILLIPLVLGSLCYVGYVYINRSVLLSIRDDKLRVMSNHDERSKMYQELAVEAIQADLAARNAWRADIDEFLESINRSQTASKAKKADKLAIESQIDRARLSYIESGAQQLIEKVTCRRDELIRRGEWTVDPELDYKIFEGIVVTANDGTKILET